MIKALDLNLSLALTDINRRKLKNSGLIDVIIYSDNGENSFTIFITTFPDGY
jgi:hypothetical protein